MADVAKSNIKLRKSFHTCCKKHGVSYKDTKRNNKWEYRKGDKKSSLWWHTSISHQSTLLNQIKKTRHLAKTFGFIDDWDNEKHTITLSGLVGETLDRNDAWEEYEAAIEKILRELDEDAGT